MAGTRSGAAALLRGVAKTLAAEAELAVCELTVETLVFLLADVQDAIDVLDGTLDVHEAQRCRCRTRMVDEPCPVHGFSDAGA